MSIRNQSGEKGARFLQTTTAGIGEQTLDVKMTPRKVLFEQPKIAVIGESDFGTVLQFTDGRLTIRRFTNTGIVVDDHKSRVEVRVYVLEGSPVESL